MSTITPSHASPVRRRQVSVGDIYHNHAGILGLELVAGERGLDRIIREPTINRPGLALSGFFTYFAGKRIQVIGSAEMSYLASLPAATCQRRIEALFTRKIPCLVFSRQHRVPPFVITAAEAASIPVFRTPMITMKFINAATIALEMEFAPRISEHGSMVDILGVGTLIRGASGIGKSECVLSLLERGYSLVSDDITRFRAVEGRELIGQPSSLTKFHMEVRGIGIINVASIFGVRSIVPEKRLDLVVTLQEWDKIEDCDRLGLDRGEFDILGIRVPHVVIPVRMGRDLGRLVEVAALDQKLKNMGQNSALEFNERLISIMQQNQAP